MAKWQSGKVRHTKFILALTLSFVLSGCSLLEAKEPDALLDAGLVPCPASQRKLDPNSTEIFNGWLNESTSTATIQAMLVEGSEPDSTYRGAAIREVVEPLDDEVSLNLETNVFGDDRPIVTCPFATGDALSALCESGFGDPNSLFVVASSYFVQFRDPMTLQSWILEGDGKDMVFWDHVAMWIEEEGALVQLGIDDRCRYGCSQEYVCDSNSASLGNWTRIFEVAVIDGSPIARVISVDNNTNFTYTQQDN